MPPTASARALTGALLLTGIPVAVAFPNSQNPFAGGPPVEIPSEASCTVTLFDHEALALYGAVFTAPYAGPPPGCPGPWAKVGLGFTGSVAGVQYDRAGALWLGGVELLRTTTPEPDAPGISWVVDRDLTAYSALFYKASNATLQIPNTVNDQYTGVLYITARLVFFPLTAGSDDEAAKAAWADAVIPLAPPPANSNPWGSMAIAGTTAKTVPLQFPRVDVTEVFLDLYASGHGCEEFWYSNVPGEWAGPLGICGASVQDLLSPFLALCPLGISCITTNLVLITLVLHMWGQLGGGSYRQIEVYIDGLAAGILYPFPVVYTGGVNPLLWRPLTGIYSFNIPPYEFDLTPFAGVLNDGKTHQLSIIVLGNNDEGSWFVDPVLRLS